jgi:hypothetical protein
MVAFAVAVAVEGAFVVAFAVTGSAVVVAVGATVAVVVAVEKQKPMMTHTAAEDLDAAPQRQ